MDKETRLKALKSKLIRIISGDIQVTEIDHSGRQGIAEFDEQGITAPMIYDPSGHLYIGSSEESHAGLAHNAGIKEDPGYVYGYVYRSLSHTYFGWFEWTGKRDTSPAEAKLQELGFEPEPKDEDDMWDMKFGSEDLPRVQWADLEEGEHSSGHPFIYHPREDRVIIGPPGTYHAQLDASYAPGRDVAQNMLPGRVNADNIQFYSYGLPHWKYQFDRIKKALAQEDQIDYGPNDSDSYFGLDERQFGPKEKDWKFGSEESIFDFKTYLPPDVKTIHYPYYHGKHHLQIREGEDSYPIIFDPANNELHVGKANTYHWDLIKENNLKHLIDNSVNYMNGPPKSEKSYLGRFYPHGNYDDDPFVWYGAMGTPEWSPESNSSLKFGAGEQGRLFEETLPQVRFWDTYNENHGSGRPFVYHPDSDTIHVGGQGGFHAQLRQDIRNHMGLDIPMEGSAGRVDDKHIIFYNHPNLGMTWDPGQAERAKKALAKETFGIEPEDYYEAAPWSIYNPEKFEKDWKFGAFDIPEDSRAELEKFWHKNPELRQKCKDKYGHDPIDDAEHYWEHGLPDEPEHKEITEAAKAQGFKLDLAKRWEKEELAAEKKESSNLPEVVEHPTGGADHGMGRAFIYDPYTNRIHLGGLGSYHYELPVLGELQGRVDDENITFYPRDEEEDPQAPWTDEHKNTVMDALRYSELGSTGHRGEFVWDENIFKNKNNWKFGANINWVEGDYEPFDDDFFGKNFDHRVPFVHDGENVIIGGPGQEHANLINLDQDTSKHLDTGNPLAYGTAMVGDKFGSDHPTCAHGALASLYKNPEIPEEDRQQIQAEFAKRYPDAPWHWPERPEFKFGAAPRLKIQDVSDMRGFEPWEKGKFGKGIITHDNKFYRWAVGGPFGADGDPPHVDGERAFLTGGEGKANYGFHPEVRSYVGINQDGKLNLLNSIDIVDRDNLRELGHDFAEDHWQFGE